MCRVILQVVVINSTERKEGRAYSKISDEPDDIKSPISPAKLP
jgi:hypothetical protein